MKKIKFNKLIIKNFLSVGNEEVEINFNYGFNIITGYNRDENDIRNGVGKSTILNAFYFAIFGATTQGLPSQKMVVNRLNGKNCKVVLEFSSESTIHGNHTFSIVRTVAPSKVRIFKDEKEKTKSTMAESNKYIKEVLSCSEEIFDNCVVMRANNTIPFMARKKADKKNFIEMIFNLGIFSDMLTILKGDMRDTKRNFDIETTSKERYLENVNSYENEIINITKENEEREIKNKEKIEELKYRIKNISSRISEIFKSLVAINQDEIGSLEKNCLEIKTKKENLLEQKVNLKSDITIAERDVKKIINGKYNCPTCGRRYEQAQLEKSKQIVLSLKNSIEKKTIKLKKLDEDINKLNIDFETINKKLIEKKSEVSDFTSKQREIENGKNLIKAYKDQIEQLSNTSKIDGTERLQMLLEKARTLYNEKCIETEKLERRIGMLEVSEHILGEHGVKSFVVNKLLDFLNSRIFYYLRKFQSTFEFTFNNVFEETITDAYGISCSYYNCSGAEAKKIDLAVSFAFNDMLKFQTGVDYNVVFFDEILDSSLDSKSLEIIVDFLSEEAKKTKKALYVITHKDNINMPNVNETILLEKTQGYTRRIK